MAKKKQAEKVASLPEGEEEEPTDAGEEDDEVELRREQREQEAAAREAERKRAWKEHELARKEAEERRKASEPAKEFVEAARKAKERADQERIDLHKKSYETEAKRRNPDEKLEKKFRDKNKAMFQRHLLAWATLQEISQGADVAATREALQVMARAWKEKEDVLIALAVAKAKKGKKDEVALEARTESLKEKLQDMEESRRKATPKPPKAKKKKKKKSE